MWGLRVAASVVAATMMMSGVPASAALSGLSWCSESTLHDIKITTSEKPELGLIEVVVNNTFTQDVVKEVFLRQQAPCSGITQEEVISIDGEQAELVLEDNDEISLFWRPPDTMPLFQKIDEFCITTNPANPKGRWATFLAKFCFPVAWQQIQRDLQSCANITCVRKCCPPQMSLSNGMMCAPAGDGQEWEPSLVPDEHGAAPTDVHMLYGPPRYCQDALSYTEFSILPSGIVKMDQLDVDINGYCIDSLLTSSQEIGLACKNKVAPAWHCEWKHNVLKPVLLSVSSVCLIITWVVYVSVARLRNLNEGRCLLSLVSALIVAYVSLIILNFTARGEVSTFCVVAGRFGHFAILASYFWMNVLSFHTFVQLRSPMDDKWERPLVFCLYSLYAWGCPLVVVVVGIVIDATRVHHIVTYIDLDCWFSVDSSFLAYLYGPMLVLLLINLGFFLGCVVLLSCYRRRVTFSPSYGQHQTFSAWLYVRLFILMGILWLTEAVSYFYLGYCSIPEYTIDVINSLQGVYVLLVTVCCRRDLKVFHCGRPKLIHKGRHGEAATSTTGEASEMAANPLVS